MMRYRLWHTWHKQDIVICANVAWRKASVVNGLITDYVYAIAFTLRLSSFSLWHTQNKRVPYVRGLKKLYRGRIWERGFRHDFKP